MNIKLILTNKTKVIQKVVVLSALNKDEPNFGLPEGVLMDLTGNDFITYKKILEYAQVKPFRIKITSSSNNRRMFFYYKSVFGEEKGIEPQKEIDGTDREIECGKSFKLDNETTISESDIFVNSFKKEWNPHLWNIADTQEVAWFDSMFLTKIYLNPKMVFELNFTIFEAKTRF